MKSSRLCKIRLLYEIIIYKIILQKEQETNDYKIIINIRT